MTERETLESLLKDIKEIESTVTTERSTLPVAMKLKRVVGLAHRERVLQDAIQSAEGRQQPTPYQTCMIGIDMELSPFVDAAELPSYAFVADKLESIRKDIEHKLVEDFTTQ
jgi:hypothetical protein